MFHQSAPKWTKLNQSAPSCTKLHQSAPSCTKVHQAAPSYTNLHQVSPIFTNLHRTPPNCTKVQQTALRCTKLHQVAPICTKPDQVAWSCTKLHQATRNCTKLHQSAPSGTYLHQVAPNCTKLRKRFLATTPCSQAVEIWTVAMGWKNDRKEWEQGYGLFRLDLTPAGNCHPCHLVSHHSGNVNLYLKFDTPMPAVLNLIVYTEFQNQWEIDCNRCMVYDLSQGAWKTRQCIPLLSYGKRQ